MAKSLFLTFDLEEFDIPLDLCGIPTEENEMYKTSYDGMKRVMRLLNRLRIKSTFFTTTTFGRRYPKLVRRLSKSGHEIAFHGYKHDHKYNQMKQNVAYKFIKDGKSILEDLISKKIIGVRSPWFFSPSYKILEKIGFEYDSSIHPTWLPGHYFNMRVPRSPSRKNGMIILPISVTPLLRLPMSWIWFRNFGTTYAKCCTRMCLLDQPYVNVYFHPWEFVDLTKYKSGAQLPILIRRNTGKKMMKMMKDYIKWCLKNGLKPTTIREGISELIFD